MHARAASQPSGSCMHARAPASQQDHACMRARDQQDSCMRASERVIHKKKIIVMHASERAYRIQKKIQQSVSGSVAKWLIVFQHRAAWPKQIS